MKQVLIDKPNSSRRLRLPGKALASCPSGDSGVERYSLIVVLSRLRVENFTSPLTHALLTTKPAIPTILSLCISHVDFPLWLVVRSMLAQSCRFKASRAVSWLICFTALSRRPRSRIAIRATRSTQRPGGVDDIRKLVDVDMLNLEMALQLFSHGSIISVKSLVVRPGNGSDSRAWEVIGLIGARIHGIP